MNDEGSDELSEQLAERTTAATRAFLNGEENAADIEWIEKASALVAATTLGKAKKSRLRQRALPFAVTLLCMIAPVVLLMTPASNLLVTIRLDTASITLTLGEQWELPSPVSAGEFFADQLTRVDSPELGINEGDPKGDFQVTAVGTDITLQSLTFTPLKRNVSDRSGGLTVRAREDDLTLISQGNAVKGELTVDADDFLSVGLTGETPTKYATEPADLWATLNIAAENEEAVLSKLTFRSTGGWNLDGFQPTTIDFEVFEGNSGQSDDSIFESAVKSGTIWVHDQPTREIRLEKGDRVVIEGAVVTELLRLEQDDGVHVVFRGMIETLSVGARKRERNIAPSMLEYVYFNWPVGAFMGIFGILSMLLLSVPKLLVG